MSLWVELWRRPGASPFQRVYDDIPYREGSISDAMGSIGSGMLTIPESFPGFDDILKVHPTDSVSSLIRVRDKTGAIVYEWLPDQLTPVSAKSDPFVEVSGRSIDSILEYPATLPYDFHPLLFGQSKMPDWIWGGPNLLQNPGFETDPFSNGGFENGNNDEWDITQEDNETLENAAGLIAVFDPPNAHDGDWYGLVDPIAAGSGARRSFNGLVPGDTYTITGWIDGEAGVRYRVGVSGASSASHTNAYQDFDTSVPPEPTGWWWAEIGNAAEGTGSATGSWEQTTLTFVAAETMVELVILYQDGPGSGSTFLIDTWTINGNGVGLFPWVPRYPTNTNIFDYQTSIVLSGNGAAVVQVDDSMWISPFGRRNFGRAGIQQDIVLEVGATYTAGVWVRQQSGSDQTFFLSMLRQSPIGVPSSPGSATTASRVVTVPTSTWTLITFSFVADVTEYFFYVSWHYDGAFDDALHASPTFYVDDAFLFKGLPPESPGGIIKALYDHAVNPEMRTPIVWDNGSGSPYLTLDFDADVDSNGVPWEYMELTFTAWMRMTLLQVMENLAANTGIEYRVVPDDPETGTWLLQVYNEGGMDAAPDASIYGASEDTRRLIRRFRPFTAWMVEGDARQMARAQSAALIADLGRIETGRLDRSVPDVLSAVLAVTQDLKDALVAGVVWSYQLTDPSSGVPLSDFKLGDTIAVVDPPEADDESRLWEVVVTFSPSGTVYDCDFYMEAPS